MPCVSSGRVLLTGANGYIATWIVKYLLDAGYAVRGTVRSESKAGHLRSIFKSVGDRLQVVTVEDITKAGAFDEHVRDVSAIIHNATPVHLNAVEPDEIIIPAVQGTLNVLKSALLHGRSVQRVILLSSSGAVTCGNPEPSSTLVVDESGWNETEVAQCRERGRDAAPDAKYRASKVFAEQAAWAFVEEHQKTGDIGWDLVVLNPSFVYGPVLHEVDKPEDLGWSAKLWYDGVVSEKYDEDDGSAYVDVRDVAQAHVLALQSPEAAGQRILLSARSYIWRDFRSIARQSMAGTGTTIQFKDTLESGYPLVLDNTKSTTILGMAYRTMEETTKDTLADMRARGWL